MSNSIRFSIITVCKNPGASFQFTLNNLQRQSYRNFELIVVDGLSTDGTLEVIHRSRNLITKFVSGPDAGIYDAMNKGIEMATGDFLYFLNCGDAFHDETVLERVAAFAVRTGGEFIFGDTALLESGSAKLTIKRHNLVDKYYLFNRPINHQAIFASRSIFNAVGTFDTSFTVKADHEWIVRCLNQRVVFFYLPITISDYQLNGFAYQNRGKFRALEKKRIQMTHFSKFGGLLVRLSNRLSITPTKVLRSLLNKFL